MENLMSCDNLVSYITDMLFSAPCEAPSDTMLLLRLKRACTWDAVCHSTRVNDNTWYMLLLEDEFIRRHKPNGHLHKVSLRGLNFCFPHNGPLS